MSLSSRAGVPVFLIAAVVFVAIAGFGASGVAAAEAQCADDGSRGLPRACTKEIRVYNNTDGPIWVVLQGSIQLTDALNCTVADKGGGDVWLQAALGDTSQCFAVKNDYYIFINPDATGVPKDGFISVLLPWWSERQPGAPDQYIDWWRGARILIFDDRKALNDSYSLLKPNPQLKLTTDSPRPRCNSAMAGNTCELLRMYEVTPEAAIGTKTPFQLNEFTFADVSKVTDGGKGGGVFLDFNQNYNVSNVDQVYLPLAVGPIRDPADIGYMGTTMSVPQFRQILEAFTGTDVKGTPALWPFYNNPKNPVSGRRTYPRAGIRVPSAQTVMSYYTNPYYFPTPPYPDKTPQILPRKPPEFVQNMIDHWKKCTEADARGCFLQRENYQQINETFLANYQEYLNVCPDNKIPAYLKPVQNNPPMPQLTAFLTFIYGWVPFNVNCPNEELPTVDQPPSGSRVPIDYIRGQYDWRDIPGLPPSDRFNPYTQLNHDDPADGGLGANAYAFSIDDQSSFQSNDGGSLPGGLVFTVGGAKGLLNTTQVAPPLPPVYRYFDFSVATQPLAGVLWTKVGICSETADIIVPWNEQNAPSFGVDPATIDPPSKTKPCTITFEDSNGRIYQVDVIKADVPPDPIWPQFQPQGISLFDPNVIACPTRPGVVPPDQWCAKINELADPKPNPPIYAISTPPPVQ